VSAADARAGVRGAGASLLDDRVARTALNARVIVVPNPVVTRGLYRWLRHPNYLAVVIEGLRFR
jgi:protein-S-isoprenylcysteine O-methyltransferase Ste14